MATNETISKLTDDQQNVPNLEQDRLSEKETDQVVAGVSIAYADITYQYYTQDVPSSQSGK